MYMNIIYFITTQVYSKNNDYDYVHIKDFLMHTIILKVCIRWYLYGLRLCVYLAESKWKGTLDEWLL